MKAFINWLFGRPDLRAIIQDHERQINSLQAQMRHAVKANGDMASHSRGAEVTLAKVRLSFALEREFNRRQFGNAYRVFAEDSALTNPASASSLQFHQPSQPTPAIQ